jgi:Flp pilus assembly protein TadD
LADNYGRFLLARRQRDLAVDAFRFATRIEPMKPSRWSNLGSAFAQSGRFDSAIEATRVALELAPSHRLGRLNLARYLLARGNPAEAEEALGDVSTLGAEGLGLRGVSRGNRGDLDGAAADFEAALAIDPQNAEARAGVAKLKSDPSGR